MQQTATEEFAAAAEKAGDLGYARENASTLRILVGGAYHYYNFVMRVMLSDESSGYVVTPFSQLDRDSLEFMRSKLIELKGNPPPLSAAKEETRQPKFRTPTP